MSGLGGLAPAAAGVSPSGRGRPARSRTRQSPDVVAQIVGLRSQLPHRGAKKLKAIWERCEPLTLCDACNRYLLRCQLLSGTSYGQVKPVMEAAFREYGLPRALRTDNGPPFATLAVGGLSRLAVWWVKLGIIPERIDPG